MSIRLMDSVWRESPFEGRKLLVLLALADAANDQGKCWLSIKSLMGKSRCSERLVQDAFNDFEREGWLQREFRQGRSTIYWISTPANVPDEADEEDPEPPPQKLHPPQPLRVPPHATAPITVKEPTTTTSNAVVGNVSNSLAASADVDEELHASERSPWQALHLSRAHSWYPHPAHIQAAAAAPRYMTVDDNIDRYLLRVKDRRSQPESAQWLQWFLDDDARQAREERVMMRTHGPDLTDESGTPRSWGL